MIAVGSILSVVVLAIGLYITNAANLEQQRLAMQGQITDRFTKAVEQLGQPGEDKIAIRLGAIYALERIMRDSAIDHPAVVEVLTAYIRVHAPATSTWPGPTSTETVEQFPHPPVDIQAALAALTRRDVTHDRPNAALNLSGANLNGANLAGADLSGAALTGTNLYFADLTGASLSGADLTEADLLGADLTGVNLSGVLLASLNRTYAPLAGANLTGANLAGADLSGMDLTRTTFTNASLTIADLSGVDLRYAELHGADLTDANLVEANLADANLSHANLTGADLVVADLTKANLTNTNLTNTNLIRANLTGARNMTSEAVRCAWMDDQTQLPAGVVRPTDNPRESGC